MESYCVIHFKDKPEKIKILTLLATETEAKYHVTTDLKEYAATIASNTANSVTPSINTLSTEKQHPSAPIVAPSPIDVSVVDQQVPVVEQQHRYIEPITIKDEIDDTVEDVAPPTTNNNTFHNFIFAQPSDITVDLQNLTNVAYQAVVVEPKEERIDVEMDIEDVAPPIMNNNAFHNFIFLQSSDVTVDPQNLMNEYGIDVPNRERIDDRSNRGNAMDSENVKIEDKCRKCFFDAKGHQLKLEHALKHLKIKKYHCMVVGCQYKTSYKHDISDHMKKKHVTQLECFREIRLTREQNCKMEKTIKSCFPKMIQWWQCLVCKGSIARKPSKILIQMRTHALNHLGIMLYGCMEEGCQYKVVTEESMNQHMRSVHAEGGTQKFVKYGITEEQELKIQEMLVKCFPKLDDTNFGEVADSNA